MRIELLIAAFIISGALTSHAADRPIRFECRGLEKFEIKGTHDVDWAWGNIRSLDSQVVIGFSIGPMVEELVPAERPAGFRSFKTFRINGVAIRYGYNVKMKQFQATLIGAPIQRKLNLVSRPQDRERLLSVAKIFTTAPCRFSFEGAPPN